MIPIMTLLIVSSLLSFYVAWDLNIKGEPPSGKHFVLIILALFGLGIGAFNLIF